MAEPTGNGKEGKVNGEVRNSKKEKRIEIKNNS